MVNARFIQKIITAILISVTVIAIGMKTAQAASPTAKAPRWAQLARQVGSAETGREKIIKELRKIKNLEQTLVDALGTKHRSLALDVIAALHLESLVLPLLDGIESDRDGFLVLTLNSLLNSENKELILTEYADKLGPEERDRYSPAAVVAMLEPLGRLGVHLPVDTVSSLLQHPFPEVGSAALGYIRAVASKGKAEDASSLIALGFDANSFQLRLQAIALASELSRKGKATFRKKTLTSLCDKETHATVKSHCFSLVRWKEAK